MKKKPIIVIATGVALMLVFVVGALVYKQRAAQKSIEEAKKAESPLVRAHAQTLGPKDAKVHIVEFMDPGCESCRIFGPFVKQLVNEHAGRVKLSIRYIPLHHGADVAVKMLEAARIQDKYWETLQLMFDAQPKWASHHHPAPEKLWEYLPAVGLNMDQLKADMESTAIAEILRQDIEDARFLNVRKTPSFFVNGEPLRQFGRDQLAALVGAAVAASY